jgi:hypothetical protein
VESINGQQNNYLPAFIEREYDDHPSNLPQYRGKGIYSAG